MSDNQNVVMATAKPENRVEKPVNLANLNKTDNVSQGTDNQNNLDIKSDPKFYDSKLTPLNLPPNLNVDPQNYVFRSGRESRESENCGRPRSFSFSDGTVSSDLNYPLKQDLATKQQSASTNPLDFNNFCVTETVNSLKPLETTDIDMVIVPYPTEEFDSMTGDILGCARTISFHSFLCTCTLTCCCMCDSLFPPDCDACLLGVCVHLTTTHLCQRTIDIFPSVSMLKDKVNHTIV